MPRGVDVDRCVEVAPLPASGFRTGWRAIERVGNKMKSFLLESRPLRDTCAMRPRSSISEREMLYLKRGAWSTLSGWEETNTARTICETFSIIERATGELFGRDLRWEGDGRETSRVAEERQRGEGRKKAGVGSIASFVDNRTVTERQVLE